ncbi:GNAT family N-acetyltransferase [Vibrio alginolyticus]|uniref:GNAT family N-acetyltransferase n=2 Tax=Vibrio alginolyticus TaxID=663 RepID=UPI0022B020D9|nr:GNAT family N-acetyltransferase [Vibrio alginolyticus]MCZ4390451.1 GNAT family N-acetyltransferase [Vibrio alginolyticus]
MRPIDTFSHERLSPDFEGFMQFQFVSREFDVFLSDYNPQLVSEELAHSFEHVVLPSIRDCNINTKKHLSWIMVALSQGKLIGYCYFWHNIKNGHSYISHIYVDSNLRGCGVASKLLDMSLDFIFSTLPNKVSVYFISKDDKKSDLVDLFLTRSTKQKMIDKSFQIDAIANSKHLELNA